MGIYYGAKIIYGFEINEIDTEKLAKHLALEEEHYNYSPRTLIYRLLEGEEDLSYVAPDYEGNNLYAGAIAVDPRATKGGGSNESFTPEEAREAKEKFEDSENIHRIIDAVEHEVKPEYHLLNTVG